MSGVQRQELVALAARASVSTPDLLGLSDGPICKTLPGGFAHDRSSSDLGQGYAAFKVARNAFMGWQQFDLRWVQVVDPTASVVPGQLVGIEAYAAFLWSVSFNRIVDVVDSPSRFGFLYATTALHVEEGQERFLLEYDSATEVVTYLIEAISRPRHVLARIGYPFSRAMQRRFAAHSHERMKRSVSSCV